MRPPPAQRDDERLSLSGLPRSRMLRLWPSPSASEAIFLASARARTCIDCSTPGLGAEDLLAVRTGQDNDPGKSAHQAEGKLLATVLNLRQLCIAMGTDRRLL